LKGVVEAGLSACGERAVPLLLEQGRAELTGYDMEDGPPSSDERFLVTEWLLADLRIDHVSPEMKARILSETDPRLRSSMLVALARNASPDVYRFLAETAEQDVRHRGDILRVVARALGNDEVQGMDVAPLTDSLGRIFRQVELEKLRDPLDIQSYFALGCRLGISENLDRLRPLLKLDFDKLGGEDAPDVRDSMAYWMGRMKGGEKLFEEFLQGIPDETIRRQMLEAFRRHPDSPVNTPVDILKLAGSLTKQETLDEGGSMTLWVLSRATTEKETILSAFRGVYERSAPGARARLTDTAAGLGAVSTPFLESVLGGKDDILVRAVAARRLLEFLPEDEVRGRLAAHYSALLVPVDPVSTGDTRGFGRNIWAYGDLVLDYYSRFGSRADLSLLDALPERVKLGRGLPEEDAVRHRSYLREQCRQAKNAIFLRLGPVPR
jgi:hypothetical protein